MLAEVMNNLLKQYFKSSYYFASSRIEQYRIDQNINTIARIELHIQENRKEQSRYIRIARIEKNTKVKIERNAITRIGQNRI